MDSQTFDDSFKQIQLKFLINLANYLRLFEGLWSEIETTPVAIGDVENYRNQIHKLAGSAKTFGFPELNRFASDVEAQLVALLGGEQGDDVLEELRGALASFLTEARKITGAHAQQTTAGGPPGEEMQVIVRDFDFSIVVVDDDELVRDQVKNGLSREKCRITQAENGTKVLDYLEKTKRFSLFSRPDLIVLDVNMPDMTGFDVLQTLKSDPEFQAIPVIMLTRRDEDETVEKAFSSGALDYIRKPFAVAELVTRIMSVLKREKQTVLIADDDELVSDLLRQRFFLMGYSVILARNGNEALARLLTDQPDIAIMDVMMPGLDGLSVLKQAKASRTSRDIPIVMLTARGEKESAIMGLDSGAHDYVTKPFDIDELAARVSAILRRAQRD